MKKYQLGSLRQNPNTGDLEETENFANGLDGLTLRDLGNIYKTEYRDDEITLPDDFGESQYDTEVTSPTELENLDNFRAYSQTPLDALGNSIVKFVGLTSFGIVSGTKGVTYGLIDARVAANEYADATQFNKKLTPWEKLKGEGSAALDAFTGNSVFKAMEEDSKELNEKFPHYYTQAERESDFASQLLTYNMWGDKFVNGLSFLASAAITGGGVKSAVEFGFTKIGAAKALLTGSRLAPETVRAATLTGSIATRAAAASGVAQKAVTITAQAIAGSGYESAIEAVAIKDAIINDYLEDGVDARGYKISERSKEWGNLTREEKLKHLSTKELQALMSHAASMHNAAFGINFAVTSLSNVFMIGQVYGVGILKHSQALNKLKVGTDKALDSALGYKGMLGATGIDRVKGFGSWGLRASQEAGEEAVQGVTSKTATDYASKSVLTDAGFTNENGDFVKSLAHALKDQAFTTEGQTEVFLGFALGAMGMPKKFGGNGLVWTGEIEEQKRARASMENLTEFQAKNLERMEELAKKNPNFGKGTILAMVAVENIRKSEKDFNDAVVAGDIATAKSIEMDNSFDMFLAKDLVGELPNLEAEFYKGLKREGEDFKTAFGYSEEMTKAQINDRKIQLKYSFESAIKNYKEAVKVVDKVYNLSEEDKYSKISHPNSPAFIRRVMIHAAVSAENRDMREKAVIAKAAELMGGYTLSKNGMVDTIVIDTPDGPRVIPMGTMNALVEDEYGVKNFQTVLSQRSEVAGRLQQLAAVPKRQQDAEHIKRVEDLQALFDVLKKETNGDKPVLSLFLENGNSLEAKTLDEWVAEDPLRSGDVAELKQLLSDARRLRAERHYFASLFQKLTTKEGKKEMSEKLTKLQKDFVEAQAATGTEAEKKALRDASVKAFKEKLALYSSDLTVRLDEFVEGIALKKETLQTYLELVDKFQPYFDQIAPKSRKKARGKHKKMVTNPQTGEKISLLTLEEFKGHYDKAVAEIPALEQELAGIDEAIQARIESTEEIKFQLTALATNTTPDPNNYENYLISEDKLKAFEDLRKTLNLPEDFNYESFTYFTEDENEVKISFKEALTLMDEGIEALNLSVLGAASELELYKIQLDAYRSAMAAEGKLAEADSDESIALATAALEEALKVATDNLKVATDRRKEFAAHYNTIRRLQAYMKAVAWDESTAHINALERVELDLETVINESLADPSYTPVAGDARFLPDIAQNKNGFFKTTGKIDLNLNRYKELLQQETLTEAEASELKYAKSQVTWYDWLSKADGSKVTPMDPFIQLMLVTKESINHPGIPQMLRDAISEDMFFKNEYGEDEDVKAVVVKTNIVKTKDAPDQSVYEIVTHQGGVVFTSLMDPKLEDFNGEDRFTNKSAVPKTGPQIQTIVDEYRAWKDVILKSKEPRLVPITGKSNGSVIVDKTPTATLIPAELAVMGASAIKDIKLVAAVKLSKEEVSTGKRIKPLLKGPSVWSKLGMVWAYDHVRGILVPSVRQKLNAETALTVSRLMQLQLKTVKEYEGLGMTLGEAVQKSKLLQLISTEIDDPYFVKDSKKPDKKLEKVKVDVTLQDHLDDLVITSRTGGQFALYTRIVGKEFVILYGSNPADDGKPYSMSLQDFTLPASQKKFTDFLQTKYHQVNATTVDNAMEEVSHQYKDKDGKPTKKSDNKFKPVKPWVKVSIGENLKVNPIEPATIFKSYNEYLLKGKDAPLMFKTVPFKNPLAVQRVKGGYLTFGKGLSQGGVVTNSFSRYSYKEDPTTATTESVVKPAAPAAPAESPAEGEWIKSYPRETEEGTEKSEATEEPFGKEEEATEDTKTPEEKEFEAADNDPNIVVSNAEEMLEAWPDAITEGVLPPAPVVEAAPEPVLVTPTLQSEPATERKPSLYDKIANTPEIFKSMRVQVVPILDSSGKRTGDDRHIVVIEVAGKVIPVVEYIPTVENSVKEYSGQLGDVNYIPQIIKDRADALFEVALNGEPFLNLFQANNPRVLQILETIEEEKARVLKMTPLSIATSQVLLTSLGVEGVAQLTDFGKVLISKFAPGGALYHEAFHNISLYVLSPKDSKYLYDKVRAIPGSITTYQGETKKLSELSNKEAEEWLAEEFRFWLLDPSYKIAETSVTDTRSAIRKFFDFLKTTIRRLTKTNDNFEFDKDLNSIEGLFKAIEGGKFLNATRHSEKGYAGVYGMSLKDAGLTVKFQRDLIDIFIAEVGNAVDSPFVAENLEDLYIGMTLKEEEQRVKNLYTSAFFSLRRKLLVKEASLLAKTEGKERPIEEVVPYTPTVVPEQKKVTYYEGNITPDSDTIFVFGSNPEGRHGAGAAKIARNQFGAIYGQGEGLQGNSYALPTKDLRVKENSGYKSISPAQITKSVKKLYEVAKQNPTKQFKVAYRNTTDKSLNGYTGLEMIAMFDKAGERPANIIFSKEWATIKEPISSPVLEKQPASKKKPSALALDFMKLEAVQAYLQITGRSVNERGNPAILKELADKHFAEMKFKEPKEATDEEVKTKDMYDREVHTEGPINTAESAIRLLLGGVTDQSSMTTASLPGTYPLSLQKIHGGKTIHGIFKTMQDWCRNSTSLEQATETIRRKGQTLVPGTSTLKYPWAQTVLQRLEHLQTKDDVLTIGMDLNGIAKQLMLVSITAQLTKANQPPLLTLLQKQLSDAAEYNRISILNPTDEAEVAAITNEWKNNLITLVNRGQAKHVKIVNNAFVFNSSGPTIPSNPKSTLPEVASKIESASIEDIIEYLRPLGVVFSNEERIINAFQEVNEEGDELESAQDLKELRENLSNIFAGLSSSATSSGVSTNLFSRNTSETASRMRKIVELEDKYGDRIKNASSHIHGKIEYDITEGNTVTLMANSVLSSLAHLNPVTVPYGRDSLTVIAQNARIEAGEEHALPVYRSIGVKEDKSGETGAKTNKLEVPEILAEKIRIIQEGFTPLPPAADKSTVLNVALGIWGPLSNGVGKVTYAKSEETLLGYLETEILASVVGMRELSYIKQYESAIQKLRYFEGVVGDANNALVEKFLQDKAATDKIYKEFKANQQSPTLDAFMEKNRGSFAKSIRESTLKSAEKLKEDLLYNKLIHSDGKGSIHVTGLDALVINAGTSNKTSTINESTFADILDDIVLRQIIGNNELFKILLGDPAFYSDLFKRIGGAPGPKTLGNTDPESIQFFGKDAIEKGYVSPEGLIKGLTIEEPRFVNKELLADLSAELQKAYEGSIDMSDGSIFVLPEVYRFLEGMTNQWGFEKETMYHRLMESKKPNGEKFKSIYGGTLSPTKPQYYGPAIKEGKYVVSAFLKMAVFPIDDSMSTINGVKYKNLDTILKFMRDNNTGFLVLPSAQKVGGVDPKSRILPKVDEVLYNSTGEIRFIPGKDGATKVDERAFTEFDIKYFGAQLKTGAESKKSTAPGTQARVQMYADMYENGEVSETLFPDDTRRLYVKNLIEKHTETINILTTKSTRNLLENLGIPYVQDELTGEWGYKMDGASYAKVLSVLEAQGKSNSLGEQVTEGIEYFKTLSEFKFEHFVVGSRMEKMLASHMEEKVTRAKYKGAGLVLASPFGYEFSEIENKDGSTTVVDKRLKLGLNKETNAYELEVFLPHYFEEFFGVDMLITNDGIINPKTGKIFPGSNGLLNMIGIRIPTDGLHSIDAVRVKGFLPQIMGPRVVVPELLVKKAGSDFDVDKLTTYFQSYKVIKGELVRERMRTLEEVYAEGLAKSESRLYTEEDLIEFEAEIESAENISARREAIKNLNAATIANMLERMANEEYKKFHDQFGAISFEQWKENTGLDIYDINTVGAIQNRIMEIMTELIQLPERKNALMSPVSTPTAKKVAKDVLEAHEIIGNRYNIPNLSSKEDEGITRKSYLSDILEVGAIARVQYAYWEGKSVTAIAAVYSTFKIKAQVVGLKLAPNIFNTVDGDAVFVKYNFAETEHFNPDEPVELGRIMDLNLVEEERARITSLNSEAVNTAVDTVNAPFLHILNMGVRNASAGLSLVAIGVPLRSVSALFNQPIVKIFTHELNITKGRVHKAFKEDVYEGAIVTNAIKAIYDSGEVLPVVGKNPIFFTYEQLMEMISTPLEEMTPTQRGYQLQILQDFRGYTALGNIMTSLMSTQAFDTNPPKGRIDVMLRTKMYQNILNKRQFINAEKITESDKFFVSELKKFTLETPKILRDLSESSKYGELYTTVMDMAMNEVLLPDVFMSYDDKLESLEKIDQLFTSMLLQRVQVDGASVGDQAQRLLFGKNTLSQQLLRISEDASHPLYENFYIHHLRPVIQTAPMLNRGGEVVLAPDYVQAQVRGLSELDQAMLSEAFKEIQKYDIETGGRLAQDIIDTAILQAGTLTSPFSFLDTVSGVEFAKKSKAILDSYKGDSNKLGVTGENDSNQRARNVLSIMATTGLLKAIVAKESTKSKSKRKTHMFTQLYSLLKEASADGGAQFAMSMFRIDHIQGFASVVHQLNLTHRTDPTFLNLTDSIFDRSREIEHPIETACK